MKRLLFIGVILTVFFGCVEQPPAVQDCGTDMGCFIEGSRDCGLAKVDWSLTVDMFGVQQTTTTYLETRGMEEDNCILYLEIKSIEVVLPETVPEEQKAEVEAMYKELEGKSGTCEIPPADLTAMLTRWNEGTLSTEDLEGYECEGSYFGEAEPEEEAPEEVPEEEAPEEVPEEEVPPELELTIDVPSSATTGEEFSGTYTVENGGDAFRAYILATCGREGYEKTCWSKSIYYIGSLSMGLDACDITERGAMCVMDYFRTPGTYVFELSVYECAEIEETLEVECSDADTDDVEEQLSPVSTMTKTVTVTGEVIIPECSTSDDCVQTCENCEEGTYRCALPEGKCVECFMDLHCKSGYDCEDYECVEE